MKMCPSCTKLLAVDLFARDKTRGDGLARSCKACTKTYRQKWLATKNETQRSQMRLDIKRWGLENPAQKLLLDRQYRKTQRYKRTQSEYLKRWRPSNKHIVNAAHARRRAQQLRAIPIWFEADQVKEVYNQANRLSKLFGKRFHVDHIIPLMNPTVCGLHCWHNLQVLDAQLNLNKTNSYQHDW